MKDRDCKTESIREFNRSADAYDQRSPFYYRMARLCDEAVLEKIAAFATPSSRILDAGCGTGALLERLRARFPDAALYGIDISPNMLSIARNRQMPGVELLEGDSENLPYRDAFFDMVVCCSSFHHYPAPAKAASEFLRVTRPGGKLLICDMDLPDIMRLFTNHILFPVQQKGDVRVYTQQEIKSLLTQQGWRHCHVERITPVEWIAIGTAPVQPRAI